MSDPARPDPWPALPVAGQATPFLARRVLCIGRNYAAHAREMGVHDRVPPFWFSKFPDAVLPAGPDGNHAIPYPSGTSDLQHEVELVVALGAHAHEVSADEALPCVYGYAVGLDMTRRDRHRAAKQARHPWEAAKSFDGAAPVGVIHRAVDIGHLDCGRIELSVNGDPRQSGDLKDLIWTVPELISRISHDLILRPGDLVFTGTPAGVGPVVIGDRIEARVSGLPPLIAHVVARQPRN